MSPSDRTHVDRYQLRAALGSGGMGKVWRAYDPRLERDVAVKEVHLPEGMSAEEQDTLKVRMFREAKAAARMSHPSVVTIHDTLEVDGVPFIVMELLDGTSLQERLATSGPLTAPEIDRITAQLLGAMRAAQRSGVVHRDIKPANIMLTDDGERAVLTDFGIANLLDGETVSLTQSGSILGTAEYVAPERLEHAGGTAPAIASDLWSLGATLFAAAAGASPFRRDSIAGTLASVMAMPAPPFPVPARSAAVVGGLLVRDPQERLTVERALEVLESGGPPPAGSPSGPQPAQPPSPPSTGISPVVPAPFGPGPGEPPAGQQPPPPPLTGRVPTGPPAGQQPPPPHPTGQVPGAGTPHPGTAAHSGPPTAPPHGGTGHPPPPWGPEPVHAQPSGQGPSGPQGSSVGRALLWVGAAVVAVIVVGATIWVTPRLLPEQDEDASATASQEADSDGADDGGDTGGPEADETDGAEEGDEITDYAGFTTEEVFLRHPEGWEPEDRTDEVSSDEEASPITVLSHHDIEPPEGDHQIRIVTYISEDGLTREDAADYHLETEEDLGNQPRTSAVERIRLDEVEDEFGGSWASVMEMTFSNTNWNTEDRWFLSQHGVDGDNGIVLQFNLPAEDEDEYAQMVEDVTDSLEPRT